MKKDRVWLIICGKRTVNTAFGVVELFPLAIEVTV
jgi:hypothetical protein